MNRPRRNHSAKFKARGGLAAIRGDKTPVDLAERYKVHPNQVWAMDTTCIPMRRGFVHPIVVLDGPSRRVLAWRLSISRRYVWRLNPQGDHSRNPKNSPTAWDHF